MEEIHPSQPAIQDDGESVTEAQGRAEQCEASAGHGHEDAESDPHSAHEYESEEETVPLAALGRRLRSASRVSGTGTDQSTLPGPELSFKVLQMDPARVRQHGRLDPHTTRNLNTPHDVFSRFLSREKLEIFAKNTNIYAHKKGLAKGVCGTTQMRLSSVALLVSLFSWVCIRARD